MYFCLLLAFFGVHFFMSEGNFVALIPLSLRCSAARRGIVPTALEKLQRATQKQRRAEPEQRQQLSGNESSCVASVHKALMGLRLYNE